MTYLPSWQACVGIEIIIPIFDQNHCVADECVSMRNRATDACRQAHNAKALPASPHIWVVGTVAREACRYEFCGAIDPTGG